MWEIRKLPGHILDINTVSDEMTKKVFNDYDDLFKIACKLIKFFTIETYY